MTLAPESLRVLGSLMEKEMVTPDTYPLSINALIAAANQRSSREPVTDLSEDQVRTALDTLEAQELIVPARDGGRVTKYEHRIRTVLTLRRDETAVLCLLLLRGPQTPGELRSRSDRMFAFEDLVQLQGTLDRLASREQPLVLQLPRIPGSREARWAHLLGDPIPQSAALALPASPPDASELEALRTSIALLEQRVKALEQRLQQLDPRADLPPHS
jgi:uncharacterized protein YceH (UPF0502 family)